MRAGEPRGKQWSEREVGINLDGLGIGKEPKREASGWREITEVSVLWYSNAEYRIVLNMPFEIAYNLVWKSGTVSDQLYVFAPVKTMPF